MEINEALEWSQRRYQILRDSETAKLSLLVEDQGGADQFQADALRVASSPNEALSDTLRKLYSLRYEKIQKKAAKI